MYYLLLATRILFLFLASSVSLGSGSEVFIADGFLSCVGDFVAGEGV